MTINLKIISSFIVLIALMVILAFVGYRGISSSFVSFNSYDHLANVDVLASDLHAEINMMAYYESIFLQTGNPKAKENAVSAFEQSTQMSNTLSNIVTLPETIKKANEISEGLIEIEQSIKNAENKRNQVNTFYSSDIISLADNMRNSIHKLVSQANTTGNPSTLYIMNMVWSDFSDLRVTIRLYNNTGSTENANTVKTILGKMKTEITQIRQSLNLSDNVRTLDDLVKYHSSMVKNFATLEQLVKDSRISNEDMQAQLVQIRKNAHSISIIATNTRVNTGNSISAITSSTINQTIMVAVAGLFLGLLLALLISLNVIRTMRRLAVYVTNITGGRFHAESGVKEKGAVGEIITAISTFSHFLHDVTTDTKRLANEINIGNFRDRFDPTKYTGGFLLIGNSINILADAYTDLIDSIPSPIMTCSMDNTIIFLNKEALSMIGRDRSNEKCYDVLATDVCHTKDCLGNMACRINSKYSGETSITVAGNRINIAVSAAPLLNNKGIPGGYVEIISNITAFKETEKLVAKTVSEATTLADRIAAASRQLNEQVEQITSGTEQQRQQVEKTATAMSEMNSTVLEVARNANQASIQTNDTLQKAGDGALLVNKVVSSINEINTVAITLQNNMQELGTQANSIGSVMNVISDIADQTNLLALNAAIEAARAGDAGRGFAVVADEVRKLAENTMSATHEVGQSISAIQSSAHANIEAVTMAVQNVADTTSLVNSSGEALAEIVNLASYNSTLVSSIATASKEQSSTSEEVNLSVENIKHIATDIALNMEQSAKAVRDLSSMAQELHDLMEKLAVQK